MKAWKKELSVHKNHGGQLAFIGWLPFLHWMRLFSASKKRSLMLRLDIVPD